METLGSAGTQKLGNVPRDIYPLMYRIRLIPDLSSFTFSGVVDTDVEVRSPTNCVILHCVDLSIHTIEWIDNGNVLNPVSTALDATAQTLAVTFDQPVPVGRARLVIHFSGHLTDTMCGFYRSVYEVNGKKRFMALTQFEPTAARRAFPCWDEPSIKAPFELTVEVPPDRRAISNMPVMDAAFNEQGRKVVRFARTPPMSTYLLACVVGEFDCIEARTSSGVLVRVFTPVGKKEQGVFALEVATRVLSFYEQYFGITYPLPKIDLITVPDFAAGAMENWGAVTYRETALLVDLRDSSTATRQRVAQVVAHELAHQWFGNLVTMECWTHLWLNEGFASYMQYVAMDHLFPEWDMWTQFLVQDFYRALKLDGLVQSHPIEVEVKDPVAVNELFDAISYSKGASLIRMLASFLGEQVFREGLRRYLSRHEYSTATTQDLWNALEEVSGKPIGQYMESWTRQSGYPVVCVVEKRHDESSNAFDLVQAPFHLSQTTEINRDRTKIRPWWVPVRLATAGTQEPFYVDLLGRSMHLSIDRNEEAWVKANAGQVGYYRVNYSLPLLKKLIPLIGSKRLSTPDRIGIENDAFALARAGLMPTSYVLELVLAYKHETEFPVWVDLCANLEELRVLIKGLATTTTEAFDAYLCDLYRPTASLVGWEVEPGESHLRSLLRTLIIGALGHAGDQSTIERARERFKGAADKREDIHPDIRFPVYTLSVEHGGREAHEAIMHMFLEADRDEEKVRCLRALGHARDPELLARTLEFALSPHVRSQDAICAIIEVAHNPQGRDMAWQFLKHNWEELCQRYATSGFLLSRLIAGVTEYGASEEMARDVEVFFDRHPVRAAAKTIAQSLERIRSNAAWLARDGNAVTQWVDAYQASLLQGS